MSTVFGDEFIGMTRRVITLDDLLAARRQLRLQLASALTKNHRRFLLSLMAGEPEWNLMTSRHLAELPPICWKLQNLARLKKANLVRHAAHGLRTAPGRGCDYELKYAKGASADQIKQTILDQLGLELTVSPQKQPMEFLVVEKVK